MQASGGHLKKFSLDKLKRLFETEKERVERLSQQLRALDSGDAIEVPVGRATHIV